MSEHDAAPAGQRPERERTGTMPDRAPPFDDDQDGVLNPHEDLGQAGKEPDVGPAIGPDADA